LELDREEIDAKLLEFKEKEDFINWYQRNNEYVYNIDMKNDVDEEFTNEFSNSIGKTIDNDILANIFWVGRDRLIRIEKLKRLIK